MATGAVNKETVEEVFGQKTQLPISDVKQRLAEEVAGIDDGAIKQSIMLHTTHVGIQDGDAIVELTDTDSSPSEMNDGTEGGTAAGMHDEPAASASGDSGAQAAESAPTGWKSETQSTVQIGKIDQKSGKPTGNSFKHIQIRENVGHPLVPDVSAYVESEYADGVTDAEAVGFAAADSDFGVQLIGEPGTGKGHLIKWLCKSANIPLVRVNMGMGMTRSKLVGRFVPRNGDSGVEDQLDDAKSLAQDEDVSVEKALEILNIREKFEWRDGLLTAAVKNGFWFLADELNAADAELLLPFNGLLEDADSRSLEITEKAQKIEPHPGFNLVATRNPAHHRGTKQMNHAFVDRLYSIRVDYLPFKRETELIAEQEDIETDKARQLVEFAEEIRNAYPSKISHKTLTFRGLQRIARRSELFGLREAARQEMFEGFDKFHSEQEQGVGEAVENALQRAFDE